MNFRLADRCTTYLNAPPKSLHKVHYVCRLGALRPLDRFAFLLLLEQLLERILVLVFKLARFKVPRLRFHDFACFELIRRWDTDDRVFMWAFDLIELNGIDLRSQPSPDRLAPDRGHRAEDRFYIQLPAGDNDPTPPPKMTQGVMTPLTPLHHLQQHP